MSGPNSFEQKLLAALHTRKAQLEEEVFSAPPVDWASFQFRFGQWEENRRLLADTLRIAKAFEDKDDTGP